VEVVAVKTNL